MDLASKYNLPEQDIAELADLTKDQEILEKGCKLMRRGWKKHMVLWFIRGCMELDGSWDKR